MVPAWHYQEQQPAAGHWIDYSQSVCRGDGDETTERRTTSGALFRRLKISYDHGLPRRQEQQLAADHWTDRLWQPKCLQRRKISDRREKGRQWCEAGVGGSKEHDKEVSPYAHAARWATDAWG